MAQFVWPPVTLAASGSIAINIDGSSDTINIDTSDPTLTIAMPVREAGTSVTNFVRLDYSDTNVDDTAWVELIASTGAANQILLFDGGGYCMELGFGAASSETTLMLIPPGGFNGPIPIAITSGTRLSIRCVETGITVSSGQIVLNLLG